MIVIQACGIGIVPSRADDLDCVATDGALLVLRFMQFYKIVVRHAHLCEHPKPRPFSFLFSVYMKSALPRLPLLAPDTVRIFLALRLNPQSDTHAAFRKHPATRMVQALLIDEKLRELFPQPAPRASPPRGCYAAISHITYS
jgi:hypothetical protein